MSHEVCKKCGTYFIDGVHYWNRTDDAGNLVKGNAKDLAVRICNRFADETCINPCRGTTEGKDFPMNHQISENIITEANYRQFFTPEGN